MSGKVTRESLTNLISQKMGLTFSSARQFVDLTLARMGEGIIHDEKLMLSGFGTFQVHSKGARPGRNPKAGKPAMITPRKIVAFKAAKGVILRAGADPTKTKG